MTHDSWVIPIHNHNLGIILPVVFLYKYKAFEVFFYYNDLFNEICTETNLYANYKKKPVIDYRNVTSYRLQEKTSSRLQKWENITVQELKAFVGISLNMGLHLFF